MAKNKKTHPIPLSAIRGSFELCQFKIGRLVHRGIDEKTGIARYWATLESYPDNRVGEDFSAFELLKKLNQCYPEHVGADEPMFQKGRWSVFLFSSKEPFPVDLGWLS